MTALAQALVLYLWVRRWRFAPGNDDIWGRGNWVECFLCPDGYGMPSFHHRNAHA